MGLDENEYLMGPSYGYVLAVSLDTCTVIHDHALADEATRSSITYSSHYTLPYVQFPLFAVCPDQSLVEVTSLATSLFLVIIFIHPGLISLMY